jgi:mono/diheme cytochrome c family protein
MRNNTRSIFFWSAIALLLAGCSINEEMRRIQNSKKVQAQQDASRTGNLTGEQIFIRSCNTCHPGGRKGFGPSLENLAKDFPNDDQLADFIRKGKANMPGQPKSILTDIELGNLIGYLRALDTSK